MVIRRDGRIVYLEAGGPPAGVFSGCTYEVGEIQLRSGDRLVAYTDGVTEATDSVAQEWGVEHLARTVVNYASGNG